MPNLARKFAVLLLAFCTALVGPLTSPAAAIQGGVEHIPDSPTGAAMVYRWVNADWVYTCTGAVIAYDKILTAAHCLDVGDNPSKYVVRVGNTTLGTGHRVNVISLDTRKDVALLRVDRNITALSGVLRINLYDDHRGYVHYGDVARVYGWGVTCGTCKSSWVLKNTRVRIVDKEARDYAKGPGYLVNAMEGSRILKGDSGGPLLKQLESGTSLVGVASTSFSVSNPKNAQAIYSQLDERAYAWLRNYGIPLNED